MSEIISIHIGQWGIGIGQAAWQLFCLEHGVNLDGTLNESEDKGRLETMFSEKEDGKYVPRALFFDLDVTTCDQLRNGPFKDWYDHEWIISGDRDSASNFSIGHYTEGKYLADETLEWIRRMTEDWWSLQGYIVTHSIWGGVGSGFGSTLLERMSVDYTRKPKITFTQYPSPNMFRSPLEPFNVVLKYLLDLNLSQSSSKSDKNNIFSFPFRACRYCSNAW